MEDLLNPQHWNYLQKHRSETTLASSLLCWSSRCPSLWLHPWEILQTRTGISKQTPPETGTRGREIKRMRGVALPEQGTSLLKARLDSACSRLGKGRWPWTVLPGSPSLPQQAPAQLLTLGFYPTKHRTSSTCRQVAGFSKHSQRPPEVFVLCHPCQGCEEALPQSRLSPLLSLHSIPVLLQNQTRASFTDRAPGTPSSASFPGELWCPAHQTALNLRCSRFSRVQESFSGPCSCCREERRKLHFPRLISGTCWIGKVCGCWVWTAARLTIVIKNGQYLDPAFSSFNALICPAHHSL